MRSDKLLFLKKTKYISLQTETTKSFTIEQYARVLNILDCTPVLLYPSTIINYRVVVLL